MTPSQFVTDNNGKVIGSGQCGDLVDLWLVEGFGNHTSYATALDYWMGGIPGFSLVVGAPQDGDIGCYNAHPGYPEGHITMHYQGEEFEQNADPNGSPAHLFPRATTYLLGYLRKDTPVNNVTITQAEYEDFQNWKAIGQQLAYTSVYEAMGGTAGNSDANPASVQPIINDIVSYANFVKSSAAWQADSTLADLSVVSTGSVGTVLASGTYVVK